MAEGGCSRSRRVEGAVSRTIPACRVKQVRPPASPRRARPARVRVLTRLQRLRGGTQCVAPPPDLSHRRPNLAGTDPAEPVRALSAKHGDHHLQGPARTADQTPPAGERRHVHRRRPAAPADARERPSPQARGPAPRSEHTRSFDPARHVFGPDIRARDGARSPARSAAGRGAQSPHPHRPKNPASLSSEPPQDSPTALVAGCEPDLAEPRRCSIRIAASSVDAPTGIERSTPR